MIIDLSKEMENHLQRVKELAEEAAEDNDQGFQSRAAAMTACSTMLTQLTKAQESLVTMERLTKVEKCVIDVVMEYFDQQDRIELVEILKERLKELE